MRLYFELSYNKEPVPFNYPYLLTGVFNKWIGNNQTHNDISLYSLSWLQQGSLEDGAINFPKGAKWFISIYEETLVDKIISSALAKPEMFCGMQVMKITQQRTPTFPNSYIFKVGSPVIARNKEATGRIKYYIFSDKESDEILTQTLIHKMDQAGLSNEDKKVKVGFDRCYRGAKTKLVQIKNVSHKGSLCPIKVEGTSRALEFAWNVGIGHLTGCGFGSLL